MVLFGKAGRVILVIKLYGGAVFLRGRLRGHDM